MKKLLFAFLPLLCLLTNNSFAQEDTSYHGIHFEQGLSWSQVKAKAKAENKYIFVDCYATWCIPCKQMDREVYTKDAVGDFANDKFISVKVQFDTSAKDNESTKNWYIDAHEILIQFKVTAFPSYLFFSSTGNIVHQGLGYKRENEFIELLNEATNPSKQLFTLLNNYNRGEKEYKNFPYLIKAVKELLKQNKLADSIGRDYVKNYLYLQTDPILFTKDNLQLIGTYLENSNEKGFDLFYRNGPKADSIIGRAGFAQAMTDRIIANEHINSYLYKNNIPLSVKPNWKKWHNDINLTYPDNITERVIVNAKLRWYQATKNWKELIKSNVAKIEKYGLDTSGIGKSLLNNMVYGVIFQHSNDKNVLQKALKWIEVIIVALPDDAPALDTYANLLYKLGRVKEAIEWEQKALLKNRLFAAKYQVKTDPSYGETLDKMKQGQKTWEKE